MCQQIEGIADEELPLLHDSRRGFRYRGRLMSANDEILPRSVQLKRVGLYLLRSLSRKRITVEHATVGKDDFAFRE